MRILAFLACAAVATASAPYVPGKAFDRFITIWLENQDFYKVERNANIDALAEQGILLTQYYGHTHPSQPNYIASVGGDYFGLDHDNMVEIPQNVSTLVDLLDTKDIDWRGYFEGVPGPGFMAEGSTPTGGTKYDYVRKHNPFVSYQSISRNGTRLAKLLSLTDFERDVAANTLPQYAHISPDMDNDGHDTSLEYAANWSMSYLTPLLNNPQFMNNTLILLTYDESEDYSVANHIGSILLGGAVPENLKNTTDTTLYSHYSILSTLQNNWDLPNLGRYDVGANVFDVVARKTGYKNHVEMLGDIARVNNSLSYSGFLNDDPQKYLPIPPPNLQLIGAGGQGVAESVSSAWLPAALEMTPYDGSGRLVDGGNGIISVNAPVYQLQAPAKAVANSTAPASGSTKIIHSSVIWTGFALGAFIIMSFWS